MNRGSALLVIGILLLALAPHAEARKATRAADALDETEPVDPKAPKLKDKDSEPREEKLVPALPRLRRGDTPEELPEPPADAGATTGPVETPRAPDTSAQPADPTAMPALAPAVPSEPAPSIPAVEPRAVPPVPAASPATLESPVTAPPAFREPLTHTALLEIASDQGGEDDGPALPTRSTLEPPAGEMPAANGAAIARPPSTLSPASVPDDASGLARFLWGVPILGLMGLGTVLMLRRPKPQAAPKRVTVFAAMPAADLPALLQHAQSAAARGAHAEAATCFDRALAISPDLTVATFCKGVCLAALGRHDDAYSAFRRAVDAEPDNAEYRIHFARAALALSRQKEALTALEPIAREMPDVAPAMLEDPKLAQLRDHPMFLAMCGAL